MENSQSQQASTNPSVSTSHVQKVYINDDVVQIRPTTRKEDVWSNYDLCVMIDGVEKARCKKCSKFYNPTSNTTLRTHKSGCSAVSQNDTSQGTIGADGQVFIFDNDAVRLDFTKFVIQQALPFNHFDNVKLTEIIKRRLQPRYQHVSRTTLRSDAFKLWETAKKDIIDGFRDYKYGVSITTDTWTAPHGTANSYLAVTAHWFNPESWLLMKRTIAFKLFGYPHTGSNLRKILHDTLIEYNLDMPCVLTNKESMMDRRWSCDWVNIFHAITSEKHPTVGYPYEKTKLIEFDSAIIVTNKLTNK
ncbi:zinc finger BED domain-containing protein DAYSLEEPER [Tanacetum coccineum]